MPAAFGWCFCSSNDRKGAGTSRVTRPLLYSNRSHNSTAFPLDYTARLGALRVCHCNGCQEFTVFCNTTQTPRGGRGGWWRGGRSPNYPSPNIDKKKLCFPCSVHSHPPGIHHTEVSNESTCLFKNSLICAHQLVDVLQDYFTIFPYSFKATVPSTCKDII